MMRKISLLVVVSVLGVSAIAKFLSDHEPSMLLNEKAYYLVAIAELLAAGGLMSSWRRPFAAMTLTAALLGSALLWWWGSAGKCGCFGSWHLGTKYHLVLLAIVGLCSLHLMGRTSGKSLDRQVD
ncbi:MAG: hypothetical protein ACE37K_07975 [Planctomycetota bacterium]